MTKPQQRVRKAVRVTKDGSFAAVELTFKVESDGSERKVRERLIGGPFRVPIPAERIAGTRERVA